jgi:hypothetical protein
MSKNAFVLRIHSNGAETFVERTVVEDMTNERFDALEKQGLVREATAAEVKAAKENGGMVPAEKAAKAPENKAAAAPANKAAPATKTK